MPVNRQTVKETLIVGGRLWLRASLITGGILALILAVIFLFIPIDGPIGEISFGALGVFLLGLGIAGPTPTVRQANALLSKGKATDRALRIFTRRGR